MSRRSIGLIITGFIIVVMLFITVKTSIKDNEFKSNNIVFIDYKSQSDGERKMAPDFELVGLNNEKIKLSDYKGKKVILNFWASWCPPCRAEMPHMEEYYNKLKKADDVEIIALNMEEKEATVKKFVASYGITFPVLLDKEGEVRDLYGVMAYPTTFFIDTDGTIVYKVPSSIDETTIKKLINAIE